MSLHFPRLRLPAAWTRAAGMFNLNDPRWGRGDDGKEEGGAPPPPQGRDEPRGQRPQGPNQGPPDLDELWRDFNRKLGGLLGGGRGGNNGGPRQGGVPPFKPDPKSTGIGAGLILGVAALVWLGTGFFIVQEGQRAVITQFGKYQHRGGRFQLAFAVPHSAP